MPAWLSEPALPSRLQSGHGGNTGILQQRIFKRRCLLSALISSALPPTGDILRPTLDFRSCPGTVVRHPRQSEVLQSDPTNTYDGLHTMPATTAEAAGSGAEPKCRCEPLTVNCAVQAQLRRDVRRATPATLTGVRGRPTLASAVETKEGTPGIESRSPRWSPPSPTIPVKITIPNIFDMLIRLLLF